MKYTFNPQLFSKEEMVVLLEAELARAQGKYEGMKEALKYVYGVDYDQSK